METSFAKGYHRAAWLRHLVVAAPETEDPLLLGTINAARTAIITPSKGSLLTDTMTRAQSSYASTELRVDHRKASRMLDEDYKSLRNLLGADYATRWLSPSAQVYKRVTHRGVKFATDYASYDNSIVMFLRNNQKLAAGRIVNILVHERRAGEFRVSETFVVLHRYIRAEAQEQEPFSRLHKDVGGRLYLNDTRCEREMVRLSQIMHHCATFAYMDNNDEERLVIWPLDRVRRMKCMKQGLTAATRANRNTRTTSGVVCTLQ